MNNHIKVRPYNEDWTVWEVIEDIIIDVDNKFSIRIPKGFLTDFASVPQIFWSLIPPHGRYGIPAIVHDYLYYSCLVDKKTADRIFYQLMLKYNVNKFKAYLMYLAVRFFGKFHCNKTIIEVKSS